MSSRSPIALSSMVAGALIVVLVFVVASVVQGSSANVIPAPVAAKYAVLEQSPASLVGTPVDGMVVPPESALVLGNLRLGAVTAPGPIYAGRGREGTLCLVVVEEDGVGSTCADPQTVPTAGVIVLRSLNGVGRARVTMLVPDDVTQVASGSREAHVTRNIVQIDIDQVDSPIVLTRPGESKTLRLPG